MKIPSHFQLVSSGLKGIKTYYCQKSFMYYKIHPDGRVERSGGFRKANSFPRYALHFDKRSNYSGYTKFY